MKTKALLFTLSLVLLSISTSCVYANNGRGNEHSFIQNYKVSPNLDLVVSTTGGNIIAVGEEGSTVEVSFIVALRGKVLDITFDQLKEYAVVEIINDNSRLEINVKRIIKRNVSVGFLIKTPINSSADLKTSGGNIELRGISGQQKIMTSGGNIKLENIKGAVLAKTSGGNIRISDSSAEFNASTSGGNISLDNIDGKLNVSTSGGNIHANNITKGLTARTSGGSIKLLKVHEFIDVSTSGGSISLDEISGSIRAITSGGNIKANIIELTDMLELKTSGGSINASLPSGIGLDLDLSADNIDTPLVNFTGSAKKNRVVGQLNGGGVKVSISTSAGTIVLNYK